MEKYEEFVRAVGSDEELRAKLADASSPAQFEELAREAGFEVSGEEFLASAAGELSDAELESVSGGYTFPQTDWIYCDNPWTNVYCSLKC